MGIILGGLIEEVLTVGQVMLARRGRGGIRGLNTLGMAQLKGAIHLVGRDVVEALALVLLGQALPIELGSLQQREGTHHVGACKGEGVLDAAVHVALGSQMDDAINLLLLQQAVDEVKIADVGFDKVVVGTRFDILEIGQIAGVGQLIQVVDLVIGIFVHHQSYHVRADESGSSCNQNLSHELCLIQIGLFCLF